MGDEQVAEQAETMMGTEYEEQAPEQVESEESVDENVENEDVSNGEEKESAEQHITDEQKQELANSAKKVLGVSDDEIVIDKKGQLKLIVKINGKKRLVTPEEFKKGFGLNQAGYEKLNQSKQIEKNMRGFFDAAKSNPENIWKLCDKLGINKEQLAKSLLQNKIDDYEMTPEQKEQKELKANYLKEKTKREEYERHSASTVHAQKKAEHKAQYTKDLSSAMDEHGFTKASKDAQSKIMAGAVGNMWMAEQNGRSLSANDAVYIAKQEWQENVLEAFNDIDDDHIVKIIPERIVKAIRKADLKRLRTSPPTSNSNGYNGQQVDLENYDDDAKRQPRKKQSMSEFFSNLRN